MAKASTSQWDKAKALYEKGESLRDIEAEVGIPYKTIDNRAKVKGWVKGSLAQHIADAVRVKTEFGTMDLAQQEVVSKEVAEQTKNLDFYNSGQNFLAKVSLAKVKGTLDPKTGQPTDNTTPQLLAAVSGVVSTSRQGVVGANPSTIIQNTNAQQNLRTITIIKAEDLG